MIFLGRDEVIVVSVTLLILAVVSSFNFAISLRRRRDAQRIADTRSISDSLAQYQEDFGFYPPASSDGKIIACDRDGEVFSYTSDGDNTAKSGYQLLQQNARACEWGQDALRDISDPDFPAYLERLPIDPRNGQGRTYIYFSTGNNFQILASLESEDEDEYKEELLVRGVLCGEYVCNHSRSSLKLPLEKSLQEYENELLLESAK